MPASDMLKSSRASYLEKDESKEKEEPNNTSRTIMLSDDEQKAFQGSKPGDNLTCEVTGTIEEDGHFHVMTVNPPAGKSYSGSPTPQDVMQRMVPGMMQK